MPTIVVPVSVMIHVIIRKILPVFAILISPILAVILPVASALLAIALIFATGILSVAPILLPVFPAGSHSVAQVGSTIGNGLGAI